MTLAAAERPRTLDASLVSLIRNGALAGITGGLVIAAVGMALGAALGTGFWSLPNGIAGIALGPAAGATRALGLVTLVGVGLHVVLSAAFGVGTLLAIRKVTHEHVATAIVLGLGLWVFNYYVIGAFVPGAHALAQLNPVWMGGGLHVIFGGVTAMVTRALEK